MISFTAADLDRFLSEEDDEPFVMLNLLRFRPDGDRKRLLEYLQALMEETQFDPRWANPVQRSLADYHVPVQLDIPEIDARFIGRPDPHISPIGARGTGEIGGVGVAAAVANAVFNATGKRVRDLPLTLDKLL